MIQPKIPNHYLCRLFLHNTPFKLIGENHAAYFQIPYRGIGCTIKYTVHLLVSMQPPPKKLLDQVRDTIRLAPLLSYPTLRER